MPAPPRTPTTFLDVLEQVWWRLDAALDLEMLEWSAKLGALEALEAGCTAIIDHHESPNAIEGSLSVIADACAEVGVRVNTCYGVTDRHGEDGARGDSPRTIGSSARVAGGWSVCTPRSRAPTRRWRLRPTSPCVTASVCTSTSPKGPDDVGAADRLRALSTDQWLVIHGVHLPDDHGVRGTIVHNPRSNMNNAVGYARPSRFANPVALGTDGIGADMVAEFQLAFVAARADDVTHQPRHGLGLARAGVGVVPGGARRPRHVGVRTDEPVAPGVHAGWYARSMSTLPASRRSGTESRSRVDAGEIRAKAAEQAARLHARL